METEEKTMKQLAGFFTIIMSLILAGCASTSVVPEKYSGYLADYSKLQQEQTASGGVTHRWISEKLTAQSYHSVIFDKTLLYPKPKPTKQVSGALLTQFSRSIDNALNGAAQGSYKVVYQPGEGVLRISPAITGVEHKSEGMTAIDVLPVAMLFNLGKAVTGTGEQDVEVFLEVAVTDSLTGELMASAVRKGEGAQLENNTEQLSLSHLKEMILNWKKDAADIFSKLAQ